MMKRSTISRLLRYCFFGVVCVVTLLALIIAEENYRGKRAWESYKQDAVARGQMLDLGAFIPPPVPDNQNFAMTPLLKPLFGKDRAYANQIKKQLELPESKSGKKTPSSGNRVTGKPINLAEWSEYLGDSDVMHALKRFDPELDEISAACQKPYSRFPLRYEDGMQMTMPHLAPLISLTKLFALRGAANLAQGHPAEAFADCETIFRLADTVKSEPTLISVMLRHSIVSIGENVIWQGLSTHQWSEGQLAALQSDLQRIDPLGEGLRSLRYEMIGGPSSVEKILGDQNALRVFTHMMSGDAGPIVSVIPQFPRAWFYQNMISSCRYYGEEAIPAFDPAARRFYPHKVASMASGVALSPWEVLRHPYSVFAELERRTFGPKLIPQFAYAQTAADEAAIACALERYRLVHNEYPESLEALVPQYFTKLPHDVINGQPFHYRRTPDGMFLLYSIGWNETDDNGAVVMNESNRQDIHKGDWVWHHADSH